MTHWQLGDGTHVEIVNLLDDHSRLCVGSKVVPVTRATDVAEVFAQAVARHGVPAAVLTDNGCGPISGVRSAVSTPPSTATGRW